MFILLRKYVGLNTTTPLQKLSYTNYTNNENNCNKLNENVYANNYASNMIIDNGDNILSLGVNMVTNRRCKKRRKRKLKNRRK